MEIATPAAIVRGEHAHDKCYSLWRQGSFEYRGTYTEANAVLTFHWELNQNVPAPWRPASGTLTDDSLTVRYDVIMNMDDFEDAVYILTR